MDALFILIIIALYAVTHWVARAVAQLGSVE